jgi:hypothetical protein
MNKCRRVNLKKIPLQQKHRVKGKVIQHVVVKLRKRQGEVVPAMEK